MPFQQLPEDTLVTFELQGELPIFQERYVSPQAGTVVLRGFFNQSAHMELPDGTRYRTLSARKDEEHVNQLAYPIVRLPGRLQVCRLRTPLDLDKGQVPKLRFVTLLEDQYYVFRQITAGQRGFELWDSMEMSRLVQREPGGSLVSNLRVLAPVPTFFLLLFPWLDSQTIPYSVS
jgi:hypothetical protein